MKKLMIAAAAAAMVGGAYAKDCIGCGANTVIVDKPVPPTYIEEGSTECVAGHVWDLSIKAKTLAPKKMACKTICKDCGPEECVEYFDNANRTFTGVAWTCYCPCVDEAGDDVDYTEKKMLFWDAKAAVGFGYLKFEFNNVTDSIIDAKPGYTYYSAEIDVEADSTTEGFRYGKKAMNAEFEFTYAGTGNNLAWIREFNKGTGNEDDKGVIPQTLTAAGLGFGTVKQYKVKGAVPYVVIDKITGAVIGDVTACACKEAGTYNIIPVCYDFVNWCEDQVMELEDAPQVPYYGTFTMKYNAKKSQTLRTTTSYLQKLVPEYCVKIIK